jgi:hypothetical protein
MKVIGHHNKGIDLNRRKRFGSFSHSRVIISPEAVSWMLYPLKLPNKVSLGWVTSVIKYAPGWE